MARYRAKQPLFLGNRYVKAGEEFSDARVPGVNWEPLDAAAKEAVAKRFGKPVEKEAAPPPPRGKGRQPKATDAEAEPKAEAKA